ncbi:hypothetical protein RSSM_06796 [Rhodopirellula sallentina SM41]|uniref:Uncharacterized protein n=1 Tax=Rhodopirellula sallentina SM41 TaxID=1263870 RepID=M5U1Q3_9BACT|nr:hypothetical protein RSSM_06796 [Rhodopirellula sallentina SM41]
MQQQRSNTSRQFFLLATHRTNLLPTTLRRSIVLETTATVRLATLWKTET